MTLKNRVEKLEGGKVGVCTCSHEEITADMDPVKALRIYQNNIKLPVCIVHIKKLTEEEQKRLDEMTSEEATRIYYEHIRPKYREDKK